MELKFSLVLAQDQSKVAVTLVSRNTPPFSPKNFNTYFLNNCWVEFLQNLYQYSVFLTASDHVSLLVEHAADIAEIVIFWCIPPLRSLRYARFKIGSWMNWHYLMLFPLKLESIYAGKLQRKVLLSLFILLSAMVTSKDSVFYSNIPVPVF